jgi:hypothetical protein
MVIAADTPAATLVEHAATGAKFTALGIPRVNLERLAAEAAKSPGTTVTVDAAYEIVIVALKAK